MKLHQKILNVTTAVLTAAWVLITPQHAFADAVPLDAIGSVTVNSTTTFYYNTPASGGIDAMWLEAIKGPNAIVKLYADWNASNGSALVSNGSGAAFDGVICVPSGSEITVDLNGFSIDRTLAASIENGEVFYIESGAVLNLTDTSSEQTGKVTGGNSTNSAGGIHVEGGGTLNLWGGSITGNYTEASGGGIFLAGADSLLYMTSGKITENTAVTSGGGIAEVDGSIRVISGEISGNTAGGSGGGLYLQGGIADLSECKITGNQSPAGGGICTNTDANLTLKNGTSVQKNTTVGGVDTQGVGGGILAMSARPIRMSGAPSVSMNSNAEGKQSNLVFWVENERIYSGGRLEDAGLTGDARIGVSFINGTDRTHCFAVNWKNTNVFSPDSADYTIFEKEGALYLRRPAELPGTGVFIAIGCGLAAVLSLIAVLIIRNVQKKKKAQKHRKKKRLQNKY